MAEAGLDVQSNTGRFFCHKCNEELSHVLEDFTCPKCNGGFVEKLSDIPPNASQGASNSSSQSDNQLRASGMFPYLELLRGFSGGDLEVNVNQNPSQSSRSTSGSGSGTRSPADMNFSFVMDMRPRNNQGNNGGASGGTGTGGSGGQNAGQNAQPMNMEHMLFSFLNDLISGLSGGGGVTVGGGFPMIANLGDYVFGREGLDAIVTQLMNQMEGTGPPPMPSDKLDRLPTVKISEEQVSKRLQCSVCWDDFKLHEEVKQLECDHVFHPNCIVPWLKLHGTCPICRKDLTNSEDPNAIPSARFEPPGQDSNEGGSRGQGGSSSSTRGNDLDRMDYDFD